MKPVSATTIVDSRYLKILAAKKDQLKDSIVFICLDDEKYGFYDIAQLRKMGEMIDKIQPDAVYFLSTKQLRVNIFDKAEFKNKDIVLAVEHVSDDDSEDQKIEDQFQTAFAGAKSIKFVHRYAEKL